MEFRKSTAPEEHVDFQQLRGKIERGAFKYIGTGSGRVVYDLGNGTVAKVAKNKKGLGQNQAEYEISQANDSALFAKVYGVSKRYSILIMEKAERVGSIAFVWSYFHVRSNRELFRVRELRNIANRYNLILPDLGRPANWGKINGRPVIVDFGFTLRVRRKYYMPPFFRFMGK